MKLNDWAIAKTTSGTIQGDLVKINSKTVIIKAYLAGKHKHIKRRLSQIVDCYEV
jgi:hypothetical protein